MIDTMLIRLTNTSRDTESVANVLICRDLVNDLLIHVWHTTLLQETHPKNIDSEIKEKIYMHIIGFLDERDK